jgi:4-hydroxy-tetrahydrodipicolinate reductase
MIRVLVNGALGRLGSIVVNLVESAKDMELAAAVDAFSQGGSVYKSIEEVTEPCDVIVDFSHHTLTTNLLNWAVEKGIPAVIATTGHDDVEKAAINEASKKIPVFFSANMSMGIALLAKMAKETAKMFPDANIEIVESHHNRKLDAPSGTALMLADAIKEVRPDATYNLGRSGMGKRTDNEIGIHALRLGNLPGTHEIIIATDNQSITLKHETYDRALLGDGALTAGRFIIGKPAGLYGMGDLVNQ